MWNYLCVKVAQAELECGWILRSSWRFPLYTFQSTLTCMRHGRRQVLRNERFERIHGQYDPTLSLCEGTAKILAWIFFPTHVPCERAGLTDSPHFGFASPLSPVVCLSILFFSALSLPLFFVYRVKRRGPIFFRAEQSGKDDVNTGFVP